MNEKKESSRIPRLSTYTIFVLIGGALGAISRYGIKIFEMKGELFGVLPNIFLVNTLGCFLIAIILTLAYEFIEIPAHVRLGLTTGFLGAFTTFSTLCKDIALRIKDGYVFDGLAYLGLSLFAGLFAIFLGVFLTRLFFRIVRPHGKKEEVAS